MDNESMGYLYSVLENCERKCNNCEYKWKPLKEKKNVGDNKASKKVKNIVLPSVRQGV